MQSRPFQGLRYGMRVGGVLGAVMLLLLSSWHAWAQDLSAPHLPTDSALMAVGLALVVGLRAMSRLDRSLG
jgi:hypothetical protein